MKKTNILLFILLISGISAFAQKTHIGISGGINFSSVNGSYFAWGHESTQINNRTGMQVGFTFDYSITESLSLFSDPSYIQKGFTYESDNELIGGPNFNGENRFQYIQLPLSLKLSLFKNKIFYVRSGLYLSFLLDAHLTDLYIYPPNSGVITSTSTDEKINNDLNSSSMGFVMGTGAAIPLSSKLKLLIDAAYLMDITNSMKDNPPNFYWGYKSSIYQSVGSIRNSSLTISVGLAMGF